MKSGDENQGSFIREPAREIPVIAEPDVLVCGGGPAGIFAAIRAARDGATVFLAEAQGCAGGIWTAGLLSYIIDMENKTGLLREMISRLEKIGARARSPSGRLTHTFEVEAVKRTLEAMSLEAGLRLQYHTRATAVLREGRRIRAVLLESKSGRQAVRPRVVIDATGDGDVAAQAGCGFDLGHPEDGRMQPFSLIALVGGIREAELRDFYRSEPTEPWAASKDRLQAEMAKAGAPPSYAKPSLFPVTDDLFLLMSNHEYGVLGIDAEQVTQATLRARREINAQIDGLRSLGGVWSRLRLIATGEQIGVREGRRIHGRYTLTLEDLQRGATFEDAVCRVTAGIDVHAPRSSSGSGGIEKSPRTQPFDIPFRALMAKDVDGLLMAGRCISGDFFAHASYRVTGNAAAMGEATGRIAAEAAKRGKDPHEIPFAPEPGSSGPSGKDRPA
ncbi:MAG: FAD-dependent oxidoreductase [Kiritimatiellia bacterium]|nr:FAD-dependent oxidoreductase [Kiritimatiellia bacterium]